MSHSSKTIHFSLPQNVQKAVIRTRRILRERLFRSLNPWKGGVLLLSGPSYLYDAVANVIGRTVPCQNSCTFLKAVSVSHSLAKDAGKRVAQRREKSASRAVNTVESCVDLEKKIKKNLETIQSQPRPRVLVCVDVLRTFYDEHISINEARAALRGVLDVCKSAARQGVTVIFVQSTGGYIPRAREHFLPWFRLSSDLTVDFHASPA